jgi:hypothetical protein
MSRDKAVIRYNGKTLLLVNDKGALKQIYTPIKLRCIVEQERIPVGAIVFAEAVLLHPKYRLLYWVNQQAIPYHFFDIQANW